MNKKAQNPGQIFLYVMTIVIIGIIFLFGYESIMKLWDTQEKITEIKFQKDLEGEIKKITPEFGSFKQVSLRLAGEYEEVCFVSNHDSTVWTGVDTADLFTGYPMIQDQVDSLTGKNVFFLVNNRQIGESLEVGKIDVQNLFKCFDVSNGGLQINIEGKGNHVVIS